MFVSNFPKIIKYLLKDLPKNDYLVLNTFLFASCWLGFSMDKSLVSMRDLIIRVNSRGKKLDLSTFSKASKNRNTEVFEEILKLGMKKLRNKKGATKDKIYFPLDSTFLHLDKQAFVERKVSSSKAICWVK